MPARALWYADKLRNITDLKNLLQELGEAVWLPCVLFLCLVSFLLSSQHGANSGVPCLAQRIEPGHRHSAEQKQRTEGADQKTDGL